MGTRKRKPPTEVETLRRGLQEIQKRLPPGWQVSDAGQDRRIALETGVAPTESVTLTAPDGKATNLAIEVKRDGSPQATRSAIRRMQELAVEHQFLLLAPFFSRRSRELAESVNANYVDLTGNLQVVLKEPALFLRDHGSEKNPYPGQDPERGLSGTAAARFVLTLCALKPPRTPWTLTEVASRSCVSLSYVSRLVALLEQEDLVRREPRGPIKAIDRPNLIRRWAEDYSLLGSNEGRLYLDPRGAEHALKTMGEREFQQSVFPFAVSGSFAAHRYAPVSTPSKLVCFVDDPSAAAHTLDILPATGAGNVFLLAAYDSMVYERSMPWDREDWEAPVPCVPPAQIAADCLTGPDRMPEEGEALLRWFQENREGWEGFPGVELI